MQSAQIKEKGIQEGRTRELSLISAETRHERKKQSYFTFPSAPVLLMQRGLFFRL